MQEQSIIERRPFCVSDLRLFRRESAIMRMNMKSINVLIDNLVGKDNDEYIQMLYERSMRGKSITGEYKKDSVSEEKLLELLEKSSKDERVLCLLIQLLSDGKINADSISDKVLEYCLNYSSEWESTLLMILAHMQLKKKQLERLNQAIETPEAFYQLFLLNLRDNNLDIDLFRKFLLENKKHLGELANFREHIEGQNINQDKIDLTNQLARAQLEECIRTSDNSLFSSFLLLLNLYDDKFSVAQFREFLFGNEKKFSNLADSTRLVRQQLCQEKVDLVDQLICERGIKPRLRVLRNSKEV